MRSLKDCPIRNKRIITRLDHFYRDEGLKKGFQKLEQPGSAEAECSWIQLILDASSNC